MRPSVGRLHDNDLELKDGYPSRAEITLMDSNDRPLLKPIVLEITETAGELSVAAGSDSINLSYGDPEARKNLDGHTRRLAGYPSPCGFVLISRLVGGITLTATENSFGRAHFGW